MTSQVSYSLSNKWIRNRLLYWGLVTIGALYVVFYALFHVSTWGVSSYVLALLAGVFILIVPLRVSVRDLRNFDAYRDVFFMADRSGITIFGKHIPWEALNAIKREGSVMRIYVADPTVIDYKLYNDLYARSGRDSRASSNDLFISPSAFEVPLDEVILSLERIRPITNEASIQRRSAVAKGKEYRSNKFLIVFGIITVLWVGLGIWVFAQYGVGYYTVPHLIILGVCIYMLYEAWKISKE